MWFSTTLAMCLNPCFSGTYSRRVSETLFLSTITRLNPCFSGTYSRSYFWGACCAFNFVLILVLVEHTLGGNRISWFTLGFFVLILVLVEHTLGANR